MGLEKSPHLVVGTSLDFLAGQVTFKACLPNGQGSMQASHPLIKLLTKTSNKAPGKQNVRAASPQDKLEFKFFLCPIALSTKYLSG